MMSSLRLFFFPPVVWFDGINKICYIDVCPNVLKSNFRSVTTLSVAATASSHKYYRGLMHVEFGLEIGVHWLVSYRALMLATAKRISLLWTA